MLEGLLLTIIVGYAFSYIAVKGPRWMIDRPKPEDWYQRRIGRSTRIGFLPMGMSIDETKRILAKR